MAGIIITQYLIFVFMVFASFVIGHAGLMLVVHFDAHLSTEKHQSARGSPDEATQRTAKVDPVVALSKK